MSLFLYVFVISLCRYVCLSLFHELLLYIGIYFCPSLFLCFVRPLFLSLAHGLFIFFRCVCRYVMLRFVIYVFISQCMYCACSFVRSFFRYFALCFFLSLFISLCLYCFSDFVIYFVIPVFISL